MPLKPAQLSARIDALLRADDFTYDQWQSANSATPFQITYKFETTKADDFPWTNVADPVAYTKAYKAAIRDALSKFASVLNVEFVKSPGAADPTLSFYRSPDLYTDTSLTGGGRGRWHYQGSEWDGHVVFQEGRDLTAENEFDLILHEIGHSLGLKHPGNYDISGGGATGPYLPTAEDHDKFTVMSYFTNPDTGIESQELMLYDIAALQQWWGMNKDTHAGNTTHRALGSSDLKVIYDAGGTDWLRYDGAGKARIDLRDGAFSALNGLDVAAIAFDTVIENGRSGAGNDRLIGNQADNILNGGRGRDHLKGGWGADVLKGGKGADLLTANKGADVLVGGRGADVFVFNGTSNEGRNTIRDFTDGIDTIRIKGLEFADLQISSAGANDANTRMILEGQTEILLKGVDANLISAADFDFV